MSAPAFTAWASCPSCGAYECHAIRPPNPAPTADELTTWERNRQTVEMLAWGERAPRRIHVDPPPPVDESRYDVVRICRCGHEWGMA